jgi:hypothetical protein
MPPFFFSLQDDMYENSHEWFYGIYRFLFKTDV